MCVNTANPRLKGICHSAKYCKDA